MLHVQFVFAILPFVGMIRQNKESTTMTTHELDCALIATVSQAHALAETPLENLETRDEIRRDLTAALHILDRRDGLAAS
jgi:hypothetical protein